MLSISILRRTLSMIGKKKSPIITPIFSILYLTPNHRIAHIHWLLIFIRWACLVLNYCLIMSRIGIHARWAHLVLVQTASSVSPRRVATLLIIKQMQMTFPEVRESFISLDLNLIVDAYCSLHWLPFSLCSISGFMPFNQTLW